MEKAVHPVHQVTLNSCLLVSRSGNTITFTCYTIVFTRHATALTFTDHVYDSVPVNEMPGFLDSQTTSEIFVDFYPFIPYYCLCLFPLHFFQVRNYR